MNLNSINYDFYFKAISLIGIFIGVFTYYRNMRIEKAKWLNQLHEKFFERDTYKKVRGYIDYNTDELGRLKLLIVNNSNDEVELQENFVDYLNFFEFIATLQNLNQLNINEINLVFGYYLKQIGKVDFIMKFIGANEFTNVASLIGKVENIKS